MVEINLLPWREYAHARARKRVKIGVAFIIILMLLVLTVVVAHRRDTPTRLEPPPVASDQPTAQIRKIKYVGYLQHHQQMWALISMPDGKLLTLPAGSLVGKNFRIKSLSQSELVLAHTANSFSPIKIPLTHS